MILNIDLGSLYMKCAIIDDDETIRTEIIKMEKNTFSVIEVLINSTVETYKSQYPIKKIHIIPNLDYIEFQVVNSESIMESKYSNYMKQQIRKEEKEQKRRERMGEDYTPTPPKSKLQEYKDIEFNHNLVKYEVFHGIEKNTLMETDILLEYVDKHYLNFLKKIANRFGKEVSIVSPIRVLRNLQTEIGSRIIINYGHSYILYVYINESNNIVKVDKQTVPLLSDTRRRTLIEKHSKFTEPDGSYIGIKEDIRKLIHEYPNFNIYTIGGNASYLQNDLGLKNEFVNFSLGDDIPLTLENTLSNVSFISYNDLQYNNVTMNIRNRLFSTLTSTTEISNSLLALVGDMAIVLLIIYLISGYKVNSEYIKMKSELDGVKSQVESYEGSSGRIAQLEQRLEDMREGKVMTYYNIAEVLKTLESPMEMSSLNIKDRSLEMTAYADNSALVYQFLNSVQLKQSENKYSEIRLKEEDIKTIYKNGEKLDKVKFRGSVN